MGKKGPNSPTCARAQRKAVTRARVLDVARAVFASRGYEGATIRLIAAELGMSTGAIFASFEDKADLYRAVYGHPPLTPEIAAVIGQVVTDWRQRAKDCADFHERNDSPFSEGKAAAYERCAQEAEAALFGVEAVR